MRRTRRSVRCFGRKETNVDYKELVKNLREEAVHQRVVFGTHGVSCQLEGAADAIETLLAERDAAVEDLEERPCPSTYKHGEHCDYISVITGRPELRELPPMLSLLLCMRPPPHRGGLGGAGAEDYLVRV